MADYKELLRRAISALPENNGAARRAVYEKARSALVGQLRAIQPPLPAREITQHRLQLEDCIRQVEQEASEAVISLGRDNVLGTRPAMTASRPQPAPAAPAPEPEPTPVEVAAPVVEPAPEAAAAAEELPPGETMASAPADIAPPASEQLTEPEPAAEPEPPVEPSPRSIEDIIAEAAAVGGTDVEQSAPVPQVFAPPPAAAKITAFVKPVPPRATPAAAIALSPTTPTRAAPVDPPAAVAIPAATFSPRTATAPIMNSPISAPVEPALSTVREVELESEEALEAEGAVKRAIETLDREARGEPTEALPDRSLSEPASPATGDESFAAADAETRSGAGLTIFLVVFAVLLAGVGGAGFWAWREGYVDLDQMFGQAQPAVTETAAPATTPNTPTMDAPAATTPATDVANADPDAAGPGNTATTTATEPTNALEGLETEDRLAPTPVPAEATDPANVLPSIENDEVKTEERLSGADTSIAAIQDPQNSVDPSVLAGNQSLLLEASTDGRSGAVPFSGTVEWSEGEDEIGEPTLIAKASIPARNLGVSLTIRKNADPSLPASHLMEVNFDVPDTFVGGSISSLPGVLLKNEELVPGTPLVGASARVVGNSFLFALSASEEDEKTNLDLLENRRWLDLAVVYGTGRNAILTLEKDAETEALFDKVIGAWQDQG